MAEQEARPAESPIPLDPRCSPHTFFLLMEVKVIIDTEIQLTAVLLIGSLLSATAAATQVRLKEGRLKTQVTHLELLWPSHSVLY